MKQFSPRRVAKTACSQNQILIRDESNSAGTVLPLTANAAVTLRTFRHPKQNRTLWIDSICIDQDDEAERSNEVANMGYVYTCAERVLVLLGEHGSSVTTIALD